ncbi:uncharacterized protein [Coffea arabica]|uniref:F-box domain-containing protein n=1 Tax=Coffea arabica TaxID=13443 RepID=A0A6P6WSJ2_COFAR
MEKEVPLYLPEGIIHHIFSFLNTKQRTQASLLSKAWLKAWRTNPRLDFDDRYFHQIKNPVCKFFEDQRNCSLKHPGNCSSCEEKFRAHVSNYALLRKHDYQDHHIEEFNLSMTLIKDDYVACDLINTWLGFAVEFGVKVLQVTLHQGLYSSYTLPVCDILPKAESLTELRVKNCRFPMQIYSERNIMCKNIKVLKFEEVYITNEMFHCLIAGCPSINDLVIIDCRGLNKIELINLCSLEKLRIYVRNDLNIKVDQAPCLENVELLSLHWMNFVQLGTSPNLKSLSLYSGRCIRNGQLFDDFVTKFPRLEYLRVIESGSFAGLERINLTSHSLKHIHWFSNSETPKELDIDAPSLASFSYSNQIIPNLSFASASSNMRSCISICCPHLIDYSWFLRLYKLMLNLVPSRISLGIELPHAKHSFQESIEDRLIAMIASTCVPVQVEELQLYTVAKWSPNIDEHSCINLIDGLLLACHPKTLVLPKTKAHLSTGNFMIKYLLNLLADRRDEESCKSPCTKLWQKDLKKVVIKQPPLDCNTLLDESVSFESGKMQITFALEWNDNASLNSSKARVRSRYLEP